MTDGPAPPDPLGPEEHIRLDPSIIKALAADSRRDIMRALQRRRKTLSELAKELGLQKATVAEHLKRLVEANLVARIEDERMWVYHELTPTGRALLEPGRSRVFLVLTVALIGLLAVVAVMVLYLYLVELPADGGLVALEPDRTTFHAARPVTFSVTTDEDLDIGTPRLEPTAGGASVPLSMDRSDGAWHFTSGGVVPPGDYKLRFGDGEPRFDAPIIAVDRVVVAPKTSEWWRGLDGPLGLDVTAGGRPLDGVVFLSPANDSNLTFTERLPAVVEDGQATIAPGLLDVWPTGTQRFRFEADPGVGPVDAEGSLVIAAAGPVVAPLELLEDNLREIQVFLGVAGGEAPARVPIKIDGEAVTPAVAGPHHLSLMFDADEPGTHLVEVGRLANATVTVYPDLRVAVAVVEGPEWKVTVRDQEGPVAGVPITLDGAETGRTDGEGRVRMDVPPPGRHVLGTGTPFGTLNRTITVAGWDLTERPPDLRVRHIGETGGGQAVDVTLENQGSTWLATTVVGESAAAYTAYPATVAPASNMTFRLSLYPPMGGELDLYAASLPLRPITITNETPGAAPTPAPTQPAGPTPTGTPVEPARTSAFGRIVSDHFRIDIPEQVPEAVADGKFTGSPTTPGSTPAPTAPDRQEEGARVVLVVLAIILAVATLYLLRGRRRP